jgi:superfamily I DNA and RNA helicase
MALQILPKLESILVNTPTRELLTFFDDSQDSLELSSAVAFHNFPLFREDEQLLIADVVLVSPQHGVILFSTIRSTAEKEEISSIGQSLEGAYSQIFSRLVRYPKLREGRGRLRFELDAKLWSAEGAFGNIENSLTGFPALEEFLQSKKLPNALQADIFGELISVLDGSKSLIRVKDRKIEGYAENSKISLIHQLEEEIRRFDRDQRLAYMSEVQGPQRIRGLAGSGKTVVLAMKAALTAIREPDARIAVTFYTKSLYQHIKQLITRFYRLHEDKDPDWNKIQVLHAWGGASINGLYYTAAKSFGHPTINYSEALSRSRSQPFGFVCADLLANPSITGLYDYIFVDEAQDFPTEFMQLALRLAKEDKLVIAYDALQTIFDVETPTAASLFGEDSSGKSTITFEEDIILHKCYRNPREIIVCAHAIGFGIYSKKLVQILESKEHWEDLGYSVETGELKSGEITVIDRPADNSPSSISNQQTVDQIIECKSFASLQEETLWTADQIKFAIVNDGVPAEDILVICADDKNSARYLASLKSDLAKLGIYCNNLQDDSYSLQDFQSQGKVTLSTIYKAKGNEAYIVHIMGMDALFFNPTPKNRNRAFTAMTRTKGWLRVSGIDAAAKSFNEEVRKAKEKLPKLVFKYPEPEELVVMKRDLTHATIDLDEKTISDLTQDLDSEAIDQLMRKLRQIKSKKTQQKKFLK